MSKFVRLHLLGFHFGCVIFARKWTGIMNPRLHFCTTKLLQIFTCDLYGKEHKKFW
jgi:hypothetical protein